MDVQDARTQDQKKQADATIKRDTATANAIEKTRLTEEARQQAAQTKLAAAQSKGAAPTPKDTASPSDRAAAKGTKGKTSKQHKHPPERFVAIVPDSGKKAAKRTNKGQ